MLAAVLAAAIVLPLDQPQGVGEGYEVVCTGIGQTKLDPRWAAYPLRLEFANPAREYLIGADIELARDGRTLFAVSCPGAWLLIKAPPGRYAVSAHVEGSDKAATASVSPPTKGQARIVLTFP